MADEVGKPTQGESHQAENMYWFLKEILELADKGEQFSEKKLIEANFTTSNTVRNVHKKLLEMNIIELDESQKLLNNEKFYRIRNIKKTIKLLKWNNKIYEHNQATKIVGKYYPNLDIRIKEQFQMRYYLKSQKSFPETYPRKLYLKKICPLCSRKSLRDFTHGSNVGPIDKRCRYCKCIFQYGQNPEGIMYVTNN